MSVNNAGYIIGAYPCAPSFHQKSEEEEKESAFEPLSEDGCTHGGEQHEEVDLELARPEGDDGFPENQRFRAVTASDS